MLAEAETADDSCRFKRPERTNLRDKDWKVCRSCDHGGAPTELVGLVVSVQPDWASRVKHWALSAFE